MIEVVDQGQLSHGLFGVEVGFPGVNPEDLWAEDGVYKTPLVRAVTARQMLAETLGRSGSATSGGAATLRITLTVTLTVTAIVSRSDSNWGKF